MTRSALWLTLVVALGGGRAAADDAGKKLSELAGELKQFLDAKKQKAITLGTLTGPDPTMNGGPGLTERLKAELVKLNVDVQSTGTTYKIKGEYKRAKPDAEAGKTTAIKVVLSLRDEDDEEVTKIVREIFDEQAIVEALGLNIELPPTPTKSAPNRERDLAIEQAIKAKPPIKEGRAQSSANGLFEMEILVGKEKEKRPVKEEEGQARVQLAKDEEYSVCVYNNHPKLEMAVTLTIDGINVFAFSDEKGKDDRPKYSVYILRPKQQFEIPGWHRTKKEVNRFKVSGYAESAVAKLAKQGDSSQFGVITATFSAAWEGKNVPEDEPDRMSEELFTTQGSKAGFDTEEVSRIIGSVRGAVSVRYSKSKGK